MAEASQDSESLREKERLYNFLKKYDLHQYHDKFLLKGVHRLSHLKDVCADDDSMEEIGLSRIERMRLKKKVKENVAWKGKFMKKITGKDKQFDAPIPEMIHKTSNAPAKTGRRSAAIIPKEEVKISRKIGEGAYGSVHEGTWADIHGAVAVAIKTLYSKQEVQDHFIKEANSMAALNHRHIIQLYGIVLSHPLMLIEELAPFGSLHDYIRKEGEHLTLHLFHTYACQIADAMAYLETRRIVHRDLAIRNILLAQVDYVKLSDFGMARVLDDNSEVYNLSNLSTKIPIAWTSPEAMTHAKFSSASDAWSYGVTIWEVYSLGKIPWKGLGPIDIRDLLVEGERLGRPERCPDDVFQLVQACWRNNPQERPSFADIYKQVQQLVPRQVRAIKAHNVMEDPNSLFFKTGELIYIIDRPSKEWLTGMTVDGKIGHCRSEFVSELITPLDDIRAKLATGKADVAELTIGSPTDVDHMVHYNHDGSKWVSENAHAIEVDPTPPSSPGKPRSGSRSGSDPSPLPFTVIDTRSPSPKGVRNSGVMSPKSPLVSKLSSNSTSNKFEPLPYTVPTSTLVDVGPRPLSPEGASAREAAPLPPNNNRPDNILIGDIQASNIDTPDNQYISMNRMSVVSHAHSENMPTQQEGDGDPYVTMQSVRLQEQRVSAHRIPTPGNTSAETKKRSATMVDYRRNGNSPNIFPGRSQSSPGRARALSEVVSRCNDDLTDDDDLEERSSYIKHSINNGADRTCVNGGASSHMQGNSSTSAVKSVSSNDAYYNNSHRSVKSPASPSLSNAAAHQHIHRKTSYPGNVNPPSSVNASAGPRLSGAAAHYDVPRSFRPGVSDTPSTNDPSVSSPPNPPFLLDSPNLNTSGPDLPDPLIPVSTPSPSKSSRRLSDSAFLPLASQAPPGSLASTTEEALVPQSMRFLYSTPNSAQNRLNSSWSGIGTKSARPIPKPRTGVDKRTDSATVVPLRDVSPPLPSRRVVTSHDVSPPTRVVTSHDASPPLPSRRVTSRDASPPLPSRRQNVPAYTNMSQDTPVSRPGAQRGQYEMLIPETLSTENNYTFIDPTSLTSSLAITQDTTTTPSKARGNYQMLSPKTLSTPSEYMPVNRTTSNQGSADTGETSNPRAVANDHRAGAQRVKSANGKRPSANKKGPHTLFLDKEELLEMILTDDEFSGCDIEICRFSLEQQGFDPEKAKEEIRVQILLGMLLPNIREEDCRKALVHCQHKTNRAAVWLLQKSEEIERREQ